MPNYEPSLQAVFAKTTVTKLAEHLGIVPSAVTQWRRVPAHHVPRVAAFTGLPEREIRPDMYEGVGAA
jgi:DNA-binding transcriptional regulator YdaS (Cro superfamily)